MKAQLSVITPMTDELIAQDILDNEAAVARLTKKVKQAKEELLNRHRGDIESALKTKDEPFGSAPFTLDGYKVVTNTPKKVEWDQNKLSAIAEKIIEEGGKPEDYIERELSVSESKYKAWTKELQDHFRDARTVTPGNISVKIEKIEDEA